MSKKEDYIAEYNTIYGNYKLRKIKELKDLKEAQKKLEELLREYKEVWKVKEDFLVTWIRNLVNNINNDIENIEQKKRGV